MGRREIFLTNLACVVPKHMIRDKVMITSLENLAEVKQKRKGKQLYYARVSYDVDKKEFFDYSSIDFLCLCVQPKNPDRTFIACEYFDESGKKSGGCGALYHPRCVGTSRKIVDGIGEFKCPLCVRKAKERDAQNNGSNAGSSGLSPSDVELEEAKISAKLETLARIDPKTLMLGFEQCQRHPRCSKPNRHPARCKLDRPKAGGNPASSENMSLSPSKLGSGSKKTTVRNATKAGVKSLEPRSRKNNIRRRPREEVPLFKFKGQGKGLLHLPEKQSYTGDASNTNSKVISVRPAVAEANTPSRRKFVNHTHRHIEWCQAKPGGPPS